MPPPTLNSEEPVICVHGSSSVRLSLRPCKEGVPVLIPDGEIEGAIIRKRPTPVEFTCSGQRVAQKAFDELSMLFEHGGGPSWLL